jgi:hypothetical protein
MLSRQIKEVPVVNRYFASSPLSSASRLGLIFLLSFMTPTCSSPNTKVESGSECSDGKDNDGDQAIDCDDSDCATLSICSTPPDAGRKDGSAGDGPEVKKDQGTQRDTRAEAPRPSSAYGESCSYSGSLKSCRDKKTTCVPSVENEALGFCTEPCDFETACPSGPSGTHAECQYDWQTGTGYPQYYCLFVCLYNQKKYPCPPGFTCIPSPDYPDTYKGCWP